jgi:MoaA/NifB/PqqE/SkfB family radical SAM enzyme
MILPEQITLLDIELSSHCNLHCPQCDRFDQQGFRNKYMDLAHLDFFQIADHLDRDRMHNLETVCLEGDHGDPVMHPGVAKIIDYWSDVKHIDLVTNGSLQTMTWWKDLARFSNLTVTFSIDGLRDTNAIYRINSNFDKIIANARSFIDAGGRAIWKYIVFKHNQHQVEQARQLAQDLGFVDFHTQVSNRNFYQNNELPIMVNGVYQGTNLEMASSVETRKTTRVMMLEKLNDSQFRSPTCSWLQQGSIYIDYLGNLIPCCMTSGLMWRKDISGQLWQKIVGDPDSINLYHYRLTEILQSDFYQQRLAASFRDISTVHHTCYGNCSRHDIC